MITEDKLQNVWTGCLNYERKQEEMLYKVLSPRMLAVCLRYAHDRDEAQDILQEGFIKVFNNRQCFRGEGSLEGWIRRIMVHTAISRYRKNKPIIYAEDITTGTSSGSGIYHIDDLEIKDLLKMIRQLPDSYRNVFNMYAIEGYSHQEISSALGMSELLSRTTLHRARALLKSQISAGNYRMAV